MLMENFADTLQGFFPKFVSSVHTLIDNTIHAFHNLFTWYGGVAPMLIDYLTDALRNTIKNLMRTVTSADDAYRVLKPELGLPRQIIRKVWAAVARDDTYTTLLNTWDRQKPVPRGWVTPTDQHLREKYQYVFEVKFYNTNTGEYEIGKVSNYQVRLISFQDAWDSFGDDLDYFADIYGIQIVSWKPDSVRQRERA